MSRLKEVLLAMDDYLAKAKDFRSRDPIGYSKLRAMVRAALKFNDRRELFIRSIGRYGK